MTKLLSADYGLEHSLPTANVFNCIYNMLGQLFNPDLTALVSRNRVSRMDQRQKRNWGPVRPNGTQRKACDILICSYFSIVVPKKVCIEYLQNISLV